LREWNKEDEKEVNDEKNNIKYVEIDGEIG
jgi:succinyl-CoA synthetase beta subunit